MEGEKCMVYTCKGVFFLDFTEQDSNHRRERRFCMGNEYKRVRSVFRVRYMVGCRIMTRDLKAADAEPPFHWLAKAIHQRNRGPTDPSKNQNVVVEKCDILGTIPYAEVWFIAARGTHASSRSMGNPHMPGVCYHMLITGAPHVQGLG